MRLSFKFIGILLREQCRLSASVPKQDGFVRLEKSGADQIDHPRRSAAGVNRIKQQTFAAREHVNRFSLPFGDNTVAGAAIIRIHENIS